MATAATSITGNGMEIATDKEKNTVLNTDVFVVKCGIDGVLAMIDAGPVNSDGSKKDRNGSKKYAVNREQYDALLKSGIPHKLLDYPTSYKPSIVRIQRK